MEELPMDLHREICRLAAELVSELTRQGLHIATAESLTGGMVSERITDVPGASAVLECGVCSYSNRIKHEVLGVSNETLEKYTEYSMQTACEMADGVRRLAGADIGIATTGIAGPAGGTDDKPVGSVFIGVSTDKKTFSQAFRFGAQSGGKRENVRLLACMNALQMALREVTKTDDGSSL